MSTTYSISDFAAEFEVTTRTIRHYEEKGMLKPKRNGQQRIYSNADRILLELILRGKRIGFSLNEIKHILDLYNLPKGKQIQKKFLLDKVKDRQQQLLEQKQLIDEMLQEISQLISRFD
jgi:DNA-binding transcriptional MerR regulator